MSWTLARKILQDHIISGRWQAGSEIGIRIDQTLTQDATGTMAYLEFERLGLSTVRTELSASYVDHNIIQTDFKNADDHIFLRTAAQRYGVWFSPPGNGVSHPVHMERFGVPGKTLLGSDSHTSTAGALGMIAIGAGGLDVALAMAGEPFFLKVPLILGVRLTGRLRPWVSAKDVILEMLRRRTVKGGVGRIIEYHGPGLKYLSATDRATIANMGAELGATTSIFPSDKKTLEFLKRHGRAEAWIELTADKDAAYDETDEIDLDSLEPLIACPASPDNVKKVSEVEGTPISQAIIGSSVNFSYRDIMTVALSLRGRTAHPGVSLEINPGSRTVLENAEIAGGTLLLNHAGARIHQSGCLGCIGMGQAPATGTASVRTFPRNFPGRSGTENDMVYLSSPETAVASAIFGVITDPRRLGPCPIVKEPERYVFNEAIISRPMTGPEREKVVIVAGPNIAPFPDFTSMPEDYEGRVLLKVGDNISTDSILPAGNDVLPLRSNIPLISEFAFERLDKGFVKRCKEQNGGVVIGGENYGQGSSREHAAIVPRYLGVRIKICKSFARIHRTNLINFGVLPLTFKDPSDYGQVQMGDRVTISGLGASVRSGSAELTARIKKASADDIAAIMLVSDLTERERASVLAGGLLNLIKKERK